MKAFTIGIYFIGVLMVAIHANPSRLLLQRIAASRANPCGNCGINPCFGCVEGQCQWIPGCCLVDENCNGDQVCNGRVCQETPLTVRPCAPSSYCICPMNYDPVLCRSAGNVVKTYSNQCAANCECATDCSKDFVIL
eukprot:466465_1